MNKRKDKDYVTASTFPFLPKNIFFWNKAILKDKLTPAILLMNIIISSPVSEKREKKGEHVVVMRLTCHFLASQVCLISEQY